MSYFNKEKQALIAAEARMNTSTTFRKARAPCSANFTTARFESVINFRYKVNRLRCTCMGRSAFVVQRKVRLYRLVWKTLALRRNREVHIYLPQGTVLQK